MKLEIKKGPNITDGQVEITLTTDTSKKPVTMRLDNVQAQALIGLLQTAVGARDFSFLIEL